jgi:hypothetical protein
LPLFSILAWRPSWLEVGIIRHNFGRGPPIKIFLSETICSIRTKFWWNSHWMVLFQKYIWQFGPSTKMAPTAIKFGCGSHLGRKSKMPDTFWKGTTQGSVQQSLVEIGSVPYGKFP